MHARCLLLRLRLRPARRTALHEAAPLSAGLPRPAPPRAPCPLPRARRQRYKKSPSFLSIHMGVRADALLPDTDVHHILLEEWGALEAPRGVLFVSMPSLLDPSLAPPGHHIVHAFTPDWIDAWQGLSPDEYEVRGRPAGRLAAAGAGGWCWWCRCCRCPCC